jgi:hypothetical protein
MVTLATIYALPFLLYVEDMGKIQANDAGFHKILPVKA